MYDESYDRFVDKPDQNLSTELEQNLALHPYKADYLAMASLNHNYVRKNESLSRKMLVDEETYSLINIYVRCSFLLSDGKPDSTRSLAFSNARDDKLLRYARLLFRYRHNLDGLFESCVEPSLLQPSYPDKLKKIR